MHFLINGKSFDFDLDVRISLLDLLARNCLASGTFEDGRTSRLQVCSVSHGSHRR
jgi:hypothetical protein